MMQFKGIQRPSVRQQPVMLQPQQLPQQLNAPMISRIHMAQGRCGSCGK